MARLQSLPRPGVRQLRVVVLVAAVVTVGVLAYSFVTDPAHGSDGTIAQGPDRPLVVTIDGTGPGQVVSYGADGNVTYRNKSLWLYHDVDPSPVGNRTVTYVASDSAPQEDCGEYDCVRNLVERVNLTTGAITRLYTTVTPNNGSAQTHDVDRVNESVLLVADISFPDRVYMVNRTSGEEIWEWRVGEAYDPSSGGAYPKDWTHVNDVEYLHDGRVMVNLRNQDQVVFLEPGEGVIENWTLGRDGDHGTLYEQHNADYIPAERGGPAVLVADSENNRLVEYQREDGSWERSWVWSDARLQWPRDADRLPNGNTLVVDSHGSRILSVAPNGSVVWERDFPDGGYDAELLGTGDESTGPSAQRADLQDRGKWATSPLAATTAVVPPLVLHGLLYALPNWTSAMDATAIFLFGVLATGWLLVEVGVRVRRRYASD